MSYSGQIKRQENWSRRKPLPCKRLAPIKTGAQCNTIETGETRKKQANMLTGYQQGKFSQKGGKRPPVIYRLALSRGV